MLKIGVLGVGHLGKIHLQQLEASDVYKLVGFYDPNADASNQVLKEYNTTAFANEMELFQNVDVVSIVTPTLSHFESASKAIAQGKHIFIEKPLAQTDEEAKKLIALAKEYKVLGQVGHVERYNPAFQAVRESITNPMFIETHRLAEFNPRGTDVSVVLDLMIHDIDVILSLVNAPIKNIDASGVAVISDTPDIANARIAFENGCVANLTSSRISLKKMRKSRFFQKDAYIAVDFLDKKVEVVKMKDAPKEKDDLAIILQNAEGNKKQIYFENPEIEITNAIQRELEDFASAIEHKTKPKVSLEDGARALAVAHSIIEAMHH
tara:strand:- start:3639 stop:4604 length:966 start_codon:yes stop_codon:yes gene_type:complete